MLPSNERRTPREVRHEDNEKRILDAATLLVAEAGFDGLSMSRLAEAVGYTPGALYRDLLILPTRVSEGPGPASPGHIRAYDVRSGKLVWIFRTIPHPGEFGYETWPPEAWKTAG